VIFSSEPDPKPQANLRTTIFTANLQKKFNRKGTQCRARNIEGVSAVMQHGAVPIKAPAFLFKHQRCSTKARKVFTGKFAFCRQFVCFASVY
jgi:hypothetical protein